MTERPAPIKATPYLTIIEHRRPKQKAHTSKGLAVSALKYDKSRGGTLWGLGKDGEWQLLHTVTPVKVPPSEYRSSLHYRQEWEPPLPEK